VGNAADALLGRTFFNGIKWDPEILADRCESPLILPTFWKDMILIILYYDSQYDFDERIHS
jgi:hypothetical protein